MTIQPEIVIPKEIEFSARRKGDSSIRAAMDFIIQTNPMVPLRDPNKTIAVWKFGELQVKGITLPAPYGDKDYNHSGQGWKLDPKDSAIINTMCMLESMLPLMGGMPEGIGSARAILAPGMNRLEKIGAENVRGAWMALREYCYDKPILMRIID